MINAKPILLRKGQTLVQGNRPRGALHIWKKLKRETERLIGLNLAGGFIQSKSVKCIVMRWTTMPGPSFILVKLIITFRQSDNTLLEEETEKQLSIFKHATIQKKKFMEKPCGSILHSIWPMNSTGSMQISQANLTNLASLNIIVRAKKRFLTWPAFIIRLSALDRYSTDILLVDVLQTLLKTNIDNTFLSALTLFWSSCVAFCWPTIHRLPRIRHKWSTRENSEDACYIYQADYLVFAALRPLQFSAMVWIERDYFKTAQFCQALDDRGNRTLSGRLHINS